MLQTDILVATYNVTKVIALLSAPAERLACWFTGMCVLMGLWAAFLLPETKGVEIEAVFRLFQNHWFWSKIPAVKNMSHVASLPHTTTKGMPSNMPGVAPGNGPIVGK